MGKLAVYRYASLMMLIIQLVVTIFTFVGLFGGSDHPMGHTAAAMLVFALPLLIVANLILLIYWLIRRKWLLSVIPVVTLLCCIPYVGTLYQFRDLPQDTTGQNGLKIASYNVALFGRQATDFVSQNILEELKKENVDVVCLQEYTNESAEGKISDRYKKYFPYMAMGNADMVIFSRYPIQGSSNLPFEMSSQSAMWANINVNGKVIKVFNVHLETTGFNRTLHNVGKIERKGQTVESNTIIRAIYGNYALGMIVRAGQADVVASERNQSNVPTIICGDFNDIPYSYVYNTMLGNLIDGFKECGSGWMYTYKGKKRVRIDYIFHDASMTGVNYYKSELSYSDHYPVFMKLEL